MPRADRRLPPRALPNTKSRPPGSLSAISLYTGAGGLDLGFEAAGFETRVAVEMDSGAVATLRLNRPSWEIIEASIHSDEASSSEILRRGRLLTGDADVLIGGPPCQPFSKLAYWAQGDARRLDDPRAETLSAYLRLLRDTQPRAFLLESVPGLAFSQKDEGLELLRRRIDEINREVGTSYSFQVELLRAVEFGVPQDRHRLFVVGARNGTSFDFPAATHASAANLGIPAGALLQDDLFAAASARGAEPFLTAWDAIGDLEDDDDPVLVMHGKWADLLPSIPEGNNYLFHTERGVPDGGKPLFGWRRRYWNFLLKLGKRLPSWTIAAHPGPSTGPFHWKNRRLSPCEMMRLQTFPSGYRLVGDLRSAQRQVGNAVPSALAEKLALEIRRQLLGDPSVRSEQLTLLPAKRGEIPPPEPRVQVPRKFLRLAGNHPPHPGAGEGPRAACRQSSA